MGIIYREKVKFEFTKNISEFLRCSKEIGIKKGFKREDLSFLYIKEIMKIENLNNKNIIKLKNLIKKRKNNYKNSKNLKLPDVIIKNSDIEILRVPVNQPTFITNKNIIGEICLLDSSKNTKFDDLVILIDFADPGYDWIFTHNIKGLITKFGNPNSHMSIRCSELGVPAAIGCGERLYEFIKKQISRIKLL